MSSFSCRIKLGAASQGQVKAPEVDPCTGKVYWSMPVSCFEGRKLKVYGPDSLIFNDFIYWSSTLPFPGFLHPCSRWCKPIYRTSSSNTSWRCIMAEPDEPIKGVNSTAVVPLHPLHDPHHKSSFGWWWSLEKALMRWPNGFTGI